MASPSPDAAGRRPLTPVEPLVTRACSSAGMPVPWSRTGTHARPSVGAVRELDRARSVRHRVVEQVVEDLIQIGGVRVRRPASAVGGDGETPGRRPLGPPVERPRRRGLPELDVGAAPSSMCRAITSSRSTIRRAIDLGLGGLELAPQVGILRHVDRPTRAGASCRSAACGAGARRSPRTRAAPHRSLQPLGHLVERAATSLTSAQPSTSPTRADRSPSPRSCAASASRWSGRASDPRGR